MKVQTVSRIGVGVTAPLVINTNITPLNVGFGVIVSGTATYTVQHTFDNVFVDGFDPATAVWFNHPTIVDQTTNQDGNYAFPITAVRLNVTAVSSGVSGATMKLIQAGI
jgi:hypothetical protein